MIFITGLCALLFVALVICNLGGVSKISNGMINPYLLFDHQTTEISDDNPNRPIINDYQNTMQMSIKKSGIDNIVAVAEDGRGEDKATVEEGTIDFRFDLVDDFQICYEPNEWIFNVTAISIGGYYPFTATGAVQQITLDQKDGDVWNAYIVWDIAHVKYTPCYTYEYTGEVFASGYISLESSYYPDILEPTCWNEFTTDNTSNTICGKKVDISISTQWMGCHNFGTQGFTIIPL